MTRCQILQLSVKADQNKSRKRTVAPNHPMTVNSEEAEEKTSPRSQNPALSPRFQLTKQEERMAMAGNREEDSQLTPNAQVKTLTKENAALTHQNNSLKQISC